MLSVGRGDSVLSRVLTALLIIFNLSNSLTFLITSQLLSQHPMIRWYSCIIMNIEILTLHYLTFFSHNAYSTLRRICAEFCFWHDDFYVFELKILFGDFACKYCSVSIYVSIYVSIVRYTVVAHRVILWCHLTLYRGVTFPYTVVTRHWVSTTYTRNVKTNI